MTYIVTPDRCSHKNHVKAINTSLAPLAALVILTLSFSANAELKIMKAKSLDIQKITGNNIDTTSLDFAIREYLISEKLDGIRAYWNGNELITRSGNKIHAPDWFTAHFPTTSLDGELWIERGKFQLLTQIVMDKTPDEDAWRTVKYMVFDLPLSPLPFEKRYQNLQQLISTISTQNDYLFAIEQKSVDDLTILTQWLDIVVNNHGEGLMLQHRNNQYVAGRTNQLLKLKQHQDAEAIVIGYEEGNGKYQGQMGAVWVKTASNETFKIGSGFTDQQRKSPPAIGTTIQYRFNGYTERGIPRFARFSRVRLSPDS